MDTEVMFSQATDVWGTPQWLFDALDKEFGFTLDPCSDGTNAKCAKFYSIHDSGLLKDWGTETVFMNPPFSRAEEFVSYAQALGARKIICFQRQAWRESAKSVKPSAWACVPRS